MEPGTIQRALQLAPECASIAEVIRKLKAEGHSQVEAHLGGGAIRRQIVERLLPTDKKRRVC